MLRRFLDLPVLFHLFAVAAATMLLPSFFALSQAAYFDARMFFYTGVLGLLFLAMVALAMSNRKIEESGVQQLGSLGLGFVILPIFLAIPEAEILKSTNFSTAYLDMVSALTTTGLRVFDPDRLPDSLLLWRALVAWFGGVLIWISAAAILAPMNLGGFELVGSSKSRQTSFLTAKERRSFLLRNSMQLFPIYAALTVILWLGLTLSGMAGFDGLIYAMSVLATSGITGAVHLSDLSGQWLVEGLIFVFLLLAVSRSTVQADRGGPSAKQLRRDPEVRFGLIIIMIVSLGLLARHILGVMNAGGMLTFAQAFEVLWGILFTTISFITTTGFVSAHWGAGEQWSALSTPALLFMGLALIGGGVATTAGGVKLLRVYSLYLNAMREVDQLIHPSSVGQMSNRHHQELRSNAFVAWIFFMMFAIALALITLALAATGFSFETALALCISALSTTGPLIDLVAPDTVDLVSAGGWTKAILCFAMILGRFEILVVLAMLSPEAWWR